MERATRVAATECVVVLESKVSLPFRPGTGFFRTWHDNLDPASRLVRAPPWKVEVVEGFENAEPTHSWLQ